MSKSHESSQSSEIVLRVENDRQIASTAGRQRNVTFEQAFTIGHSLLGAGKYRPAEAIKTKKSGKTPRASQ